MRLPRLINSLSLRAKFVLPVSIVMTALVMFVTSYLIDRQANGYRREAETSGATMIRMLAMHVESGVLFEAKYELDEALKILSQFDVVTYAAIYNQEGELLAEIGAWDDSVEPARIENGDTDSANEDLLRNHYLTDLAGNDFIELRHPVLSRIKKMDREVLGMTGGLEESFASEYVTEEIGSVMLILSLKYVNKSISEARTTAIILTVVVLVIALAILTSLINLITRPVQQLVQATDRIGRGDLTQQVDIQQSDEIGQLAHTFNKMVESLQQSRDEIEGYNRTLESKIIERTMELEEAQAQLIQTEKLGAIGQLAAGVAHELNNPLGGILGYAQFTLEKMRKNVPGQTTEKEMENYKRYLGDIEGQARRCKNIVQNLLRFSRSSRSTEFANVDINRIIDDTRTFVEHQLNMNNIELEFEPDENLPVFQGNAGQLQQIFTNLIINAMHASPAESIIKIRTRYSKALGEFGGAIEILCIDQGAGIAQEDLKKIFEPFFTTKELGKGTGLGLSVSYGIVKDHGGEIKVDSEVGKGTTFTVILPLQKPQEASDTDSEDFFKTLSGKTRI